MSDGPAFNMYIDKAGEYRWTLVAANNEPVADSAEGYKTEQSCRAGMGLVKRFVNDPSVHLHDSTQRR